MNYVNLVAQELKVSGVPRAKVKYYVQRKVAGLKFSMYECY